MNVVIENLIKENIDKVWKYYTSEKHIKNWNFANEEWCCPKVINNLFIDGEYYARMELRDGNMGFDFRGVYTKVDFKKEIEYVLEDKRFVNVKFIDNDNSTLVIIEFEAEKINSKELQKMGWQAILNNFKYYVENN